ncbi:MAG: CU044_2847 family protein [Microcoleus sp.]
MLKLTEILAPDGSKIYIQYDEEESDELRAVGLIEDVAEKTARFRAVVSSTVNGYAEILLDAIQDGVVNKLAPSKVIMEFGVQAGGETGVPFVTKGSAQANVKITIEWDLSKRNRSPESQGVTQ